MKTKLNFHGTSLALTVALFAVQNAFGTTVSWTDSQVIPDNNASGVAFTFTLPPNGPLGITDVSVDLAIAGGWNGDLYAYLSHGSGFAVLLNRIGSTSANPGGSGVSGMNVHLSDSYFTDIHTALNNPLVGNFAPDGRAVSPFVALNTDPRTATFSSFNGLNPAGLWTIFFADVSPIANSTIQTWSVNITAAVPEPGSFALIGMVGVIVFIRRSAKLR